MSQPQPVLNFQFTPYEVGLLQGALEALSRSNVPGRFALQDLSKRLMDGANEQMNGATESAPERRDQARQLMAELAASLQKISDFGRATVHAVIAVDGDESNLAFQIDKVFKPKEGKVV